MTTKECLKKYQNYKAIIKYLDNMIALKGSLGVEPCEEMASREHWEEIVSYIEHEVNRLSDPTEQLLIRLRYFEGHSWTKIGFTMHYSKTQLQRIHKRALEHLEQSGAVIE